MFSYVSKTAKYKTKIKTLRNKKLRCIIKIRNFVSKQIKTKIVLTLKLYKCMIINIFQGLTTAPLLRPGPREPRFDGQLSQAKQGFACQFSWGLFSGKGIVY